MPEIDERQLAEYRNVDAFVRRGLQNPKTRRKILEVQKALNPDTPVPEIDESDPIREEVKELRGEIQKDREDRQKAIAEWQEKQNLARMTVQWKEGQDLAKKKGYAEEGLKKLEAFMEEKGIPSHEVAIPYFEKVNPPPVSAVSSGTRWDFFGTQADQGPDLKKLYEGHDEQFLSETIADTLNKVRSSV